LRFLSLASAGHTGKAIFFAELVKGIAEVGKLSCQLVKLLDELIIGSCGVRGILDEHRASHTHRRREIDSARRQLIAQIPRIT
jgi:hypothetical protein